MCSLYLGRSKELINIHQVVWGILKFITVHLFELKYAAACVRSGDFVDISHVIDWMTLLISRDGRNPRRGGDFWGFFSFGEGKRIIFYVVFYLEKG